MNRHYRDGYRRDFTNDLNDIERQLQEFDPKLYVMYRQADNSWLVMDEMTETAIMKVPQIGFSTLDQRVYREIRRVAQENFSAIAEIEEKEWKRKKELEWQQNDLAESFARETVKSVVNM